MIGFFYHDRVFFHVFPVRLKKKYFFIKNIFLFFFHFLSFFFCEKNILKKNKIYIFYKKNIFFPIVQEIRGKKNYHGKKNPIMVPDLM